MSGNWSEQGESNESVITKGLITDAFNLYCFSTKKSITVSDAVAIDELSESLENSFLGRFHFENISLEGIEKAGELLNIILLNIEAAETFDDY